MIDQTFYEHILNNLTLTTPFLYGSAEGETAPYIVMFNVSPTERPETLCENQGDSGRIIFQFNLFAGGTVGPAYNAAEAIVLLNALKVQVATIRGNIGVAPDDYNIWNNSTDGVQVIGEGTQTLQTWGCFFESTIWWRKL